ncbi:hypothetical protein ACQKGO_10270 [Corallococcus interemptor]
MPHDVFDLVDLAMGHASTPGESYRAFMRYQRLVHAHRTRCGKDSVHCR